MFGKKTLRLATAALMVGVTLGAQQLVPRHASAAGETGVISLTDWQFPDGCNGLATASVADQEICAPMQDSLFYLDNHLNYQPDLVKEMPTTANHDVRTVNGNLVVDYKLKPNLKWSDGSPLTADDLTFNVQLNLAIGNTFGLDQIKDMKSLNGGSVWEVTYKGIYAPFVAYGNPSPLYPKAYLQKKYGSTDITTIATKFGTDVYNQPSDVFSGAYKIDSWTNGQSIVIVPNPYYTALPPASGHPRPAQIKFVNIASDESSLIAALGSPNAGVDKAEDFQLADLPGLNATKYHIQSGPILTVEHLELNQNGPLKDIRLRQALTYGLDRVNLFKQLFPATKNVNDFMLPTVMPNSSPWFDKSEKLTPYDPNKAKALMRAAGYADSYNGPGKHLLLRFATTGSSTRQKAFQIISRYWAQIGVHLTVNFASGSPSANGGMFSPYNLNGVLLQRRFDVALFAFSESPDPQQQEDTFDPSLIPSSAPGHHGAGDQNYTGITDQDQFNLLAQARHELDNQKRHALINQWQKLVNTRAYWIMLYARPNITADDGTIGNYILNPSQAGNSWNAFQWYKKGAS